jgi:hypothetical protein
MEKYLVTLEREQRATVEVLSEQESDAEGDALFVVEEFDWYDEQEPHVVSVEWLEDDVEDSLSVSDQILNDFTRMVEWGVTSASLDGVSPAVVKQLGKDAPKIGCVVRDGRLEKE